MSSVRRVNPRTKRWREALAELSGPRIYSDSVTISEERPLFNGYPYSGQSVIKFDFSYRYETRDGDSSERPMSVLLRPESGLLILNPNGRSDLSNEVMKRLRSALAADLSILPNLSITNAGIWNFVTSNRWYSITVEYDDSEYNFESTQDWAEFKQQHGHGLEGQIPIRRAEVQIEYEDQEGNSCKVSTTYSDGRLTVPEGESVSPLQRLETHPQFDQDAIAVLQRFEIDAIYPN